MGSLTLSSSYNRVNGTHVSENPYIIQDILRKEWGSDALVMSDWFGVYSIDHAINAGLDLEMPGTNKWRTLDLMNRSYVLLQRCRELVSLTRAAQDPEPQNHCSHRQRACAQGPRADQEVCPRGP